MADKAWKAFERAVSGYFGTTRTALSGGNGKVSRSDSHHSKLFISCKYSAKLPIDNLYREEKEKADKENKVPILCLKKKGQSGFYIVLHSSDLIRIDNARIFESLQESPISYTTNSEGLE